MNQNEKPKNLIEIIQNNMQGYKLKFGYSLEIDHGLLGYFPAHIHEPKQIVYCLDLDLLEKVWRLLPYEKAKIRTELYYVEEESGLAYPLVFEHSSSFLNKDKCVPDKIMTETWFEELTKDGANPFAWASGVIGGPNYTSEGYDRLITEKIKEEKEKYAEVYV